MPKAIIAIMLGGGMDGLNAVSYRDTASATYIAAARQSAPANIRPTSKAAQRSNVTVAKNSATFTLTDITGISIGNLCYGFGFDRIRKLTVSSIVDNGNGTSTLTISGASYKTGTGKLYFAAATLLFDMNESPTLTLGSTPVEPGLNQNLRWMADAFNVADTPENASQTKVAVISLIGPMLTKYFKLNDASGIYNLRTYAEDGVTLRPITGNEWPKNLTSHNDQQSTWVANAPEGAIKGWGGGIADTFVGTVGADLMKQLVSISVEPGNAYSAGAQSSAYYISNRAILLQYPGYATAAYPTGLENATNAQALTDIIKLAGKLDPDAYENDFHLATSALNIKAEDFQNVLKTVPEITSAPGTLPATAAALVGNLRQILKLMLMNNPNRGFVLSRAAGSTTVTAQTAVSNGTATRAAGATATTVYCPGHGLFTSNTGTDVTDSVIITGLDGTPPAAGYKITLVPGSEDDYFTVTTTATTALVDAPVTLRLKHNLAVGNKVFLNQESATVDATKPANGYSVVSAADAVSITFETADTTALSNVTSDVKLIHLEKQVFFTNTPGMGWDSHNSENSPELGYLDEALAYLDSVGRRIAKADYVGFTMSDFGRTFRTNGDIANGLSGGTDHGWGNCAFVFGKKIKGNRFYGDALDYNPSGPHIGGNMLIPTTSVYQYGATFAKWMGATDAQVLELFPKLVNWPVNQRYLGFL